MPPLEPSDPLYAEPHLLLADILGKRADIDHEVTRRMMGVRRISLGS